MELMSHSSTFLLPPSTQSPPSLTYALVVLNQSLPRFSPLLWSHEQHNYACVPTEVPIGFMTNASAIASSRRIRCSRKGTKIVDASHDQDTTDLHKCVAYICDWAQNLDKPFTSISLGHLQFEDAGLIFFSSPASLLSPR
ncbi:hypothetical protein M0R45_011079 [Rubus argutus]|uniref:Uncharacterized protein n=1 Tax=Rubus argutus TaxID=59490 RepID=A0AAW1Y8U0_RUBAR